MKHLHRAGVITTAELPQLGGDEHMASPKIGLPTRVLSQWSSLRKSNSLTKGPTDQGSSVNGEDSEHLVPAKQWGNTGTVGAKRWEFD